MNGEGSWIDGQSRLEVDIAGPTTALWIDGQSVILGSKAAGYSISQHSFIFMGDNGSEAGSSPLAAVNTNILIGPGVKFRQRFLIDVTSGDPSELQFQVEYRRKPNGGSFGPWTPVV